MSSSIEKISIALPPEMVAQLRQAVETGEYASSSEVVRDALRDWTYKRRLQRTGIEELRWFWQQAREDDAPGIAANAVLDRLERKYQTMVKGLVPDQQTSPAKAGEVPKSTVVARRTRKRAAEES